MAGPVLSNALLCVGCVASLGIVSEQRLNKLSLNLISGCDSVPLLIVRSGHKMDPAGLESLQHAVGPQGRHEVQVQIATQDEPYLFGVQAVGPNLSRPQGTEVYWRTLYLL